MRSWCADGQLPLISRRKIAEQMDEAGQIMLRRRSVLHELAK
jgi:hypothetical protein